MLAIYSGFLGHKYATSVHLLRHWLSMKDDNSVLWSRCDLRHIESDLVFLGISKQDLLARLKTMEPANLLTCEKFTENLVTSCRELQRIVIAVDSRRRTMRQLDGILKGRLVPSESDFAELARETAIVCLGTKRIGDVIDRATEQVIGFRGVPRTDKSILSNRSPMFIFITASNADSLDRASRIANHALDQLNAHRLADTCIVLTPGIPSEPLRTKLAEIMNDLPRESLVTAMSLGDLRNMRRRNSPIHEILDEMFMSS